MTTKVSSQMTNISSPKIISLTYPNNSGTGATPAGNETITITGTGFSSGATVYIDTTSCTTTYVSATSVTFTSPAKTSGSYHRYDMNQCNIY